MLWRIRTIEARASHDDTLAMARKVTADLHSQGLIVLEQTRAGESEVVPEAQVSELLLATSPWEEPKESAEGIFIIATAIGEEVYFRS